MECRLLKAADVEIHNENLTNLMEMVLKDNITQKYPDDQAAIYVRKIPSYIEDGSAIVVGAFDKDKLIGFSWAYELAIFGERRVHIDMIGVNPNYRKQGIAGELVRLQVKEAQGRGIHIIEAMTTRANENSYYWFHSLGFVDERVKVKLEIE